MKQLFPILFLISFYAIGNDEFTDKIKPIFDNRCLACHSCYNAPCQFNLQTYEGFDRGASKEIVYQGTRIHSISPTRMGVDAQTTQEWREKKFFPVNNSKILSDNILAKVLALKDRTQVSRPQVQVAESQVCPDKAKDVTAEISMPYGFPAIEKVEQETINNWILRGAPGPNPQALRKQMAIHPNTKKQLRLFETFLNQKDLRYQLVSRYLYEHLFLAHLYLSSDKTTFFRLVRSKTSCDQRINEIATRRPNDDPGVKNFFYCFKKLTGTFVTKTHIPYELNEKKLERFKQLFFGEKWTINSLPSYENTIAENPFIAFQDLPIKARYQFLLDDARYHLNTFIKGPVCNGSQAVNSIQEQFYVFFMDPDADLMVNHPEFEKLVRQPLMLPGVWGSDVEVLEAASLTKKIINHRETYRRLRAEWREKIQPEGHRLEDIWDGDKTNPNAFLTVFRHDDNAVVLNGAVGDLSKTVFMLDYPLFERLVYNLVVNFDVFGNIGHQLLTRVYMDLIRMEAEEMFLSFLPEKQRLELRQTWYQGFLTEAKMKYVFPLLGKEIPTQIHFNNPKKAKQEMIQKVLWQQVEPIVKNELDPINWKKLESPYPKKQTALEEKLSKIVSINSEIKYKFPQFFPEVSYLLVKMKEGESKFYTLIRNREHKNISWILGEELRLAPEEDTLSIKEGYAANYPNLFFDVDESQIDSMIKEILKIKSQKDFSDFIKSYGVSRTAPEFWSVYDEVHALFKKADPVEFGYLDLTRYGLQE